MKKKTIFPGAAENSPSRAQYFSWINNTNEGATEAQTLANLGFFRWLHQEFGMILDIYAFDAGALDGAGFYGSDKSERFQRQFPRGFGPLTEAAAEFSGRLGIWGGPDGFGNSPEEARRRIELMERLCRDYHFELFKFDAVCGQLPLEKQDYFVEMMTRCRKHSPDLILLNHRLELGRGLPHATTFLFEGAETYIDVHMTNEQPATHNRACALARGLPPQLKRLTEDHGVCLSSCLDFWEDDLMLQAFNRCLILAPEIYGNPWLLRDNEYPKLARIYNLHRQYRDLLVKGIRLPNSFGPNAVSRGNADTRLITLRNLTWQSVRHKIPLGKSIGLKEKGQVEVRQLHPTEQILGTFNAGASVTVEVLPFRACLLLVSAKPVTEVGVNGCPYEIVRAMPQKSVEMKLLGLPGTTAAIQLAGTQRFKKATLDRKKVNAVLDGTALNIRFPGSALKDPWHRKLGNLKPAPVPKDAQALYEATCFAADNNAFEVRELKRSGPTQIEAVRLARDAFFQQPLLRQRYLWDRYLFDDHPESGFAVSRRWGQPFRVRGGSFRIDLGKLERLDRLVLEAGGEYFLQPLKSEEAVNGAISADLKTWTPVTFFAHQHLEAQLPGTPIRYIRIQRSPDLVRQVRGYTQGRALDRTLWRASNLFASYSSAPAINAWTLRFNLREYVKNSYLAIPIYGQHGYELAYAALRVGSGFAGAPRRAPSFPSNTWEGPFRQMAGNYTYYIPVTKNMIGKPLEAVVLLLRGGHQDIKPEAWITAYPTPYAERTLILEP